jgi:4a-hydroxytetrahydrobiopterin dehydratase
MRLKQGQIETELAKVKGWKLRGKSIYKLYIFEDFMQGIRFIDRVASAAEGMNHHPDIEIRYNKVKLTLTTHDQGGLTKKDFKLAAKIDQMKPS